MKKSVKTRLTVLSLLLGLMMVLFVKNKSAFAEYSLEHWYEKYDERIYVHNQGVVEAFKKRGVDGVAFLRREFRKENASSPAARYRRAWQKMPHMVQTVLPSPTPEPRPETAVRLATEIGPSARGLELTLVDWLKEQNQIAKSQESRSPGEIADSAERIRKALYAFESIGCDTGEGVKSVFESLPSLYGEIFRPEQVIQKSSIKALREARAFMEHTVQNQRTEEAARRLSVIGLERLLKEAPELEELLRKIWKDDPSPEVKLACGSALKWRE